MSKEVAWASNAMVNPVMMRPITHSFDIGPGGSRDTKYAIASAANSTGQPLGSEYFPSEIFVAKGAKKNYETLPELFFAGSYWVVSGEVADIMLQFDLGHTNLYPTKVFRKDRKTPIGDRWFCINFGNVKKAYVSGGEDHTPHIKKPEIHHVTPIMLKDDMFILNAEALKGPAIWVDPQIRDTFFVSDGLAKALKAAGLARAFGFKRCQIEMTMR